MELLNNYLFKDMFKLSSLKIKSTFQVDVIDVSQNIFLAFRVRTLSLLPKIFCTDTFAKLTEKTKSDSITS